MLWNTEFQQADPLFSLIAWFRLLKRHSGLIGRHKKKQKPQLFLSSVFGKITSVDSMCLFSNLHLTDFICLLVLVTLSTVDQHLVFSFYEGNKCYEGSSQSSLTDELK